jgi:hypothetical protein
MERYLTDLCSKAERKLKLIERCDASAMQRSDRAIEYLERLFVTLKERIVKYSFSCDEDEINFFKQTKPRLLSSLIYYQKVHNVEINRPMGSNEAQMKYFRREMERIKDFFDRNHEIYIYYRSGSKLRDREYFIRWQPCTHVVRESFCFERDPMF